MAQNSERDRVIGLIRKMMARTTGNGCSNAEMEESLAKIGQYMEQYDISMSEVDIREGVCVEHVVDSGVKKHGATLRISVPVAMLCGVRVWVTGGGKKRTDPNMQIHFFGLEADVLMAEFMFTMIRDNMATETGRYMAMEVGKGYLEPGKKKSTRVSFGYGYVSIVAQRLVKMKNERDEALIAAGGSSSRALIIVKQQVVEEQFAARGMRLRARPQTYKRKEVGAARLAGQVKGSQLDLNVNAGAIGRNKLMLE